ncbi:MAG TPA: methyltransferase [Usitatibacter sp.]|nr:methyltransferase [Usitatibacter sp.]
MATPEFPKRDPATPEFWDLRYSTAFAPWDAGKVPRRLTEFVASRPASRVLVPGCGIAHDVAFLAAAGWDVTGIDFSPEAVKAARSVLGPFASRVHEADFFAPIAGEPFDLVYERAFLCALPRRLWPRWAERVAALVRPGGLLAGFFFLAEGERGPPFPLHSHEELRGLLDPRFEPIEERDVPDSIPVFAGKERWHIWRKKGSEPFIG